MVSAARHGAPTILNMIQPPRPTGEPTNDPATEPGTAEAPTRMPDDAAEDAVTRAYLEVVRRLEGFTELDAEVLDGYLTALACAPRPLDLAGLWEPIVGDGYERCFADPADRAVADAAIAAWYARIVARLDPAGLESGDAEAGLRPYLFAHDEAEREQARAQQLDEEVVAWLHDGAYWAEAFLKGLALARDWAAVRLSSRIDAAMLDCEAMVHGLTLGDRGEPFEAHVRKWWQGRRPSRDERVDAALVAVEDLRLLWLEASLRPEPMSSDKVGRNDPCPCGSGRKFKKCHGA